MNKVFGYARVSTIDQNLDTQIEALEKFGCNTIFQDKISGLSTQRLALDEMLSILREDDTVVGKIKRTYKNRRESRRIFNFQNYDGYVILS